MSIVVSPFRRFVDAFDAIFKSPATIRQRQIGAFLGRIGEGKNFELVRSELPEAASPTYRGAEAFQTNAELYVTLTVGERKNLEDYFKQSVKEAFAEFPRLKQEFPRIQI
jgi:hypothetical protein